MDNDAPRSNLPASAPSRKPKGFKIALIILAALIVLFALTIYFLPHFLPIGTIRDIAKTKAREMANMDLHFGDLSFGWNGDVVVSDITLAPLTPDGAPGDPLLVIKEARTNVALTPLLSGKAIVNAVEVNGFTATVRREADGSLNLPDFSKLSETALAPLPSGRSAMRFSLSAVADAGTGDAAGLPPIEIHRLDLNKGVLSFIDAGRDLSLDAGLDFLHIEGKTLDDPYVFSGRLLPYRDQPDLGDLPFTGRAAMLKGGAFDPAGEATLEIDVKNLSLHEMADKFGLGDLVRSARADGIVRTHYADAKIAAVIPELRIEGAYIGLEDGRALAIPDSALSLNALFDPASGSLSLSDISLTNDIAAIRGQGRVDGINNLAIGGTPSAAIDFSGAADFARASHFAASQELGLANLPELDGKASFIGKASLPPQHTGGPLAPTLSIDFNDGNLQGLDNATGAIASIDLKGLGLRAAATLADTPEINASLTLAGVPGRAFVSQISRDPLTFTLNGGAAVTHGGENSVAELRLENTQAHIPATPWSSPASVHSAQARLRFDLNQDLLRIDSLHAGVNDAIQGGVTAGSVTGILAGNPQGQVDFEVSTVLEHIRQLLQPVFPAHLAPQLTGTLRGATRLKIEGGKAEALVRGELDNSRGLITPAPDTQAEFQTPKTNLSLLASVALDAPGRVAIHSLEATAADTVVNYVDASGQTVAGMVGSGLVKAAGALDADAGQALLSSLSFDVGSINLALGAGGQPIASIASGLTQTVAATPEQPLRLPLSGAGDFSVPNLDFGIDNLVFRFKDEESKFGNVRAQLGVDGYLGADKRQLINVRKASVAAAPLALNSRGQFDLGSGAILAEYAARIAPTGLSSVLGYLGLPPSLLGEAAVTGTLGYNGNHIQSKGAAQGRLQTGDGQSAPFEMAHDISAAWNPADSSLALEVRRLDGNVKTASGEAVATMAAQPSKLLLSRAGSKGLLDVRVNGSAGPSRNLVLGLAGVLPQLGGVANTLHQAQADGVYNAWLQVHDQDPATLAVNIGGEWQGAALSVGGVPYLAEAEKLSANLVGEVAYQDNQVRLSRLFLRSDSGMMQADGTAAVSYVAGENHMPTGLGSVAADLTFVIADITRLARVFPGVVPGNLNMTGRIDGAFKAAGDIDNIAISQCAVNFRQFTAKPAEGMDVVIPDGNAVLGGTVSLHLDRPAAGSPYDVFTMLDLQGGQASLHGASVRGKAVNEMTAAFQLQNGVFTLDSASVSVGGGEGGAVQAAGRVNFTQARPAVDMRVALQHIPLIEANSEISDYLRFQSGVLHAPARQGQTFGVAFAGFDEDSILRTLALDNFNFATGQVAIDTGPVLNQELDKARVIMRQNQNTDSSRRVTFSKIEGSVLANGSGVITFPEQTPINLIGEDTADFRAFGSVRADHTLDMRVMVAGKLEELIGFTIPNLIPNLSLQQGEQGNRLMNTMNASAAQGKYGVNVTGSLESPDISGIGPLAGQFLQDMLKSELLGGVLGLGKDAPQALLNLGGQVIGGALNPAETLKNAPGNIIHAPENVLRGIGGMFGVGGGNQQQQGQEQQQGQPQQQQQANPAENIVRGLGQIFGGQQQQQQGQQQQGQPQQEQHRRGFNLPFGNR